MSDISNILYKTERELEEVGENLIKTLGLHCTRKNIQVKLADLFPEGNHSSGEHIELDYLVPYGEYCLVGEITSTNNSGEVKSKIRKLGFRIGLLERTPLTDRQWRILGVEDEYLHLFRGVRHFRGFFMCNTLEQFDMKLSTPCNNITIFGRSEIGLLAQYAESIGKYGKQDFLKSFELSSNATQDSIHINQDDHKIIRTEGKIVVGDDSTITDIFCFEVNPYELLKASSVFRRDLLPDLNNHKHGFQRALIPEKINTIRENLLGKYPDYMFPGSILVILTEGCSYDEEGKALIIPKRNGTVSIIDGQHRLYSYAHEELYSTLGQRAKILVTAIKPDSNDPNLITNISAKAFVEINFNQTKINQTHIDAIAYDLLGEDTPRALAAKIILEGNKRGNNSPLHGLFDTTMTGLGIISAKTVLSKLYSITNIASLRKIEVSRANTNNARKRQGYVNLFGINNINELYDKEVFIKKGIIAFEHYFSCIKNTFKHDYPKRNEENLSALKYSKVIAAFVRLWYQFLIDGLTWDGVSGELQKIRDNVMSLTGQTEYNNTLFVPSHEAIPNARNKDGEIYTFLNKNRIEPISIEDIVPN